MRRRLAEVPGWRRRQMRRKRRDEPAFVKAQREEGSSRRTFAAKRWDVAGDARD